MRRGVKQQVRRNVDGMGNTSRMQHNNITVGNLDAPRGLDEKGIWSSRGSPRGISYSIAAAATRADGEFWIWYDGVRGGENVQWMIEMKPRGTKKKLRTHRDMARPAPTSRNSRIVERPLSGSAWPWPYVSGSGSNALSART